MTSFEDTRFPSSHWHSGLCSVCDGTDHAVMQRTAHLEDPPSGLSKPACKLCIFGMWLSQQAFRNRASCGIRCLIQVPVLLSERRILIRPTARDGTWLHWLATTLRDAHSRCSIVDMRKYLQLARRSSSFCSLSCPCSVFSYRARYQNASIAFAKSKRFASRETTFSPLIARFLSLPSHLLKIFNPLLARFGDPHEGLETGPAACDAGAETTQ